MESLNQQGFNWNFNSSRTQQNSKIIYWIVDYGYSFADKEAKQIVIHYGGNPLQQY